MYGRFDYFGISDIERELTEAGLNEARGGRAARKWIRVKKEMLIKGGAAKEENADIRAEIERLEATNSPFPEARERRIEELRAELDEGADKLGRPEVITGMKYGGTRYKFLHGIMIDHVEKDKEFRVFQVRAAFQGGTKKLGSAKTLAAAKKLALQKADIKEEADVAGELLTERKQKLLTAKIRKDLPALYSQENVKDPMVHARFFSPYHGAATWLATEFDGKDSFFGAVNLGHGWELGYFSLSELEGLKKGGLQLVERDAWFKPKPLSQAKKA